MQVFAAPLNSLDSFELRNENHDDWHALYVAHGPENFRFTVVLPFEDPLVDDFLGLIQLNVEQNSIPNQQSDNQGGRAMTTRPDRP